MGFIKKRIPIPRRCDVMIKCADRERIMVNNENVPQLKMLPVC